MAFKIILALSLLVSGKWIAGRIFRTLFYELLLRELDLKVKNFQIFVNFSYLSFMSEILLNLDNKIANFDHFLNFIF